MSEEFNEKRDNAVKFICGCENNKEYIPSVKQTTFIEGFKSGSPWTLAYLVNHPDELVELLKESETLNNQK